MNDSLRILHLTAGSDAGGVSRYLHDLCAAMQSEGHTVAVAGERGAWHGMFCEASWPWIEVPLKGGPLKLRRAVKTLKQHLAKHPVDLLHAHSRKGVLVARQVQKITQCPILYTLHLSHIPLRGPWGWLSDFGDHVHAASSDAREWLTESAGVAAEKITVIPHGIDPKRFPMVNEESRQRARELFGLNSRDCVAVFVGRLEKPKNEDWLLDLAIQTRTLMPDLRILLVGSGPNETKLKQRIKRNRLGDRVQLLGQRDPLTTYHAADALLLPSAREGFSYVCAEAMCAGIPVLRTRTSGTSELIMENVTGCSVPIDRNRFLEGAIEFLSDKVSLRRMGLAAARHVNERFTFARQVNETIALYRRLID